MLEVEVLVFFSSWVMILAGFCSFLALFVISAPYGRYSPPPNVTTGNNVTLMLCFVVIICLIIICICSMGISNTWSLSMVSYGVAEFMDHGCSVYRFSAA